MSFLGYFLWISKEGTEGTREKQKNGLEGKMENEIYRHGNMEEKEAV